MRGGSDASGQEIRSDYGADTPIHLVAVLKGAFMFLADLMRAWGDVTCDFIAVRATAGRVVGRGAPDQGPRSRLEGRDVVIVEDIVDTGLTLSYLQEILRAREPRTLKTACLLSKPSRRKMDVTVDYIGFTIEDRFVVGYGLDFDERYRQPADIAVVAGRPEWPSASSVSSAKPRPGRSSRARPSSSRTAAT